MMRIIKLGLFIVSLILISCRRASDADNFTIGSPLKMDILAKSEVIYFTKNYLVLSIDFKEKGDFASNMALFFYDKKLQLTNKAFPTGLETFKGNKVTFFGNINELDISNFPEEFYFEKFYKSKYSGGIRIENKIITNSSINKKSKKITLQINRSATNLLAVWELDFPLSDSLLLKEFPIKDTLIFKLDELSLSSNSITYSNEVRVGFYESHNLFFQSNLQKEQFYSEILKCIGYWCKC